MHTQAGFHDTIPTSTNCRLRNIWNTHATIMSTSKSNTGLATFESLHIGYEHAYASNPLKAACISQALSLLPPSSQTLDLGCGTGVPMAQALALAGHTVTGIDISPSMIQLASSRVPGTFLVRDMLTFASIQTYDAVFLIFATMQLDWADVRALLLKAVSLVKPGGMFVFGTMPADRYAGPEDYGDGEGTYVEHCLAPFMREMIPHTMMSEEGLRRVLRGFGIEIVWEVCGEFVPVGEGCLAEMQQYIIGRKR